MIKTVFIDYDGTIHDWDTIITRGFDGILNLRGEELYRIWVYEVHRAIIHAHHLDRHDDVKFHCKLLFKHLDVPFDQEKTTLICKKFNEASTQARTNPIYFPDVIPTLQMMKNLGMKPCLSTGTGAEKKAETLEKSTGTFFFDHVFSEKIIGYLKTEPEYYRRALEKSGSEPSETVSIGDTPLSDIRPAKMVGIKTIWLNRRDDPAPNDPGQTADHEVKNLLEAVRLLTNWRSSSSL